MAAFRILVLIALYILCYTEAQQGFVASASRQRRQDYTGYLAGDYGGYPYSSGYYGGASPYSAGVFPYNYPYGAYSGYPGNSNLYSAGYSDYPYSGFYKSSGQYY